MDETRRFLRFVIPGTLFAVEMTVLLLLLRPDWFLEESLPLKDILGIGTALAALLASGALGYLFSVLYHCLHWNLDCSTLNYSPIIKVLIGSGRLKLHILEPCNGGTQRYLRPEQVTREAAWTVLSTLWYTSLHDGKGAIKDTDRPWVDVKVTSLSDLTHSAGIACVASIFALVAALLIAASFSRISHDYMAIGRFVFACALGVTLSVVFWKTYRRVGRMTQEVIEQVLLQHLCNNEAAASVREMYVWETDAVFGVTCRSSEAGADVASVESVGEGGVNP